VPVCIIFLQDVRGLSLTQVGLMEALFWITMMLSEVPTGAVADRWGRRTSLALGGFLFTIGSLCFALLNSFSGLTIAYVVMALSMTLYSGAGHALLFDSLRCLRRTGEYEKHIGRSEALMTGALLGSALLGGPMAGLGGMQSAILIGTIPMAVAGAIALLLREPPRTEAEFAADGLYAAPISAADATSDRSPQGLVNYVLEGFRIVLQRRTVLWIIILSGLITVAFEMPGFFLQPMLRQHGLSPEGGLLDGALWSALIVPGFAAMSIGALLAARFVGRVGERRAIPLLMFGGSFFFLPLLLTDHLAIIAPIAILGGLHAMIRPIATGYINRRIPSDQRATVLSIYELMLAAQMAVLVPLISASADQIDFRFAYGLSAGVVLTFGVYCLFLWRRSHQREQVEALRRISIRPAPQASVRQELQTNGRVLHGVSNGFNGNSANGATPEQAQSLVSTDSDRG